MGGEEEGRSETRKEKSSPDAKIGIPSVFSVREKGASSEGMERVKRSWEERRCTDCRRGSLSPSSSRMRAGRVSPRHA